MRARWGWEGYETERVEYDLPQSGSEHVPQEERQHSSLSVILEDRLLHRHLCFDYWDWNQ